MRYENDIDEDEKQLTPWLTARYPLAGRPRLKQRLERLVNLNGVIADITIAEAQQAHKVRLPRGARWSHEHQCHLAPARGR